MPKTSKATDVIEPTNLVLRGVDLNNPDVLYALKRLTRKQWRPDFVTNNGVIIELKGAMDSSFPGLVKLFKEQHPGLFLNYRLAFQNPIAVVPNSRKRLTYGDWADEMGITWCWVQQNGRGSRPWLPNEWLHDSWKSETKYTDNESYTSIDEDVLYGYSPKEFDG